MPEQSALPTKEELLALGPILKQIRLGAGKGKCSVEKLFDALSHKSIYLSREHYLDFEAGKSLSASIRANWRNILNVVAEKLGTDLASLENLLRNPGASENKPSVAFQAPEIEAPAPRAPKATLNRKELIDWRLETIIALRRVFLNNLHPSRAGFYELSEATQYELHSLQMLLAASTPKIHQDAIRGYAVERKLSSFLTVLGYSNREELLDAANKAPSIEKTAARIKEEAQDASGRVWDNHVKRTDAIRAVRNTENSTAPTYYEWRLEKRRKENRRGDGENERS